MAKTVDEYLDNVTEALRPVANRLRELVTTTLLEAEQLTRGD